MQDGENAEPQAQPELQPVPPPEPSPTDITWQASEYLHHEKDYTWTLLLVAITAFLAVAAYYLLENWLSAAVIVLASVALGIYAHRKPETLTYTLTNDGLHIADKFYAYDQFRSFSLIDEGSIKSILLEPLRRFMPPLSIYFDPQDEERITQRLSGSLPLKQRQLDYIDRLFKKLRF